ncbi:rhodanese-like domain-containing protein [Anaeromyxobacter terrae]|uniref:rhodanese-like domain-containing protein n=1 Tax=Anaeromyxobacter terrae TaxID=2925406 RepID=UPI001F564B38|nr:rhodanese-like domain-containing protein [Anaeromyxobacter sp. SG22]
MRKLLAVLAVFAFAGPVLAQEEGAGEYASSVSAGRPLDVPPGIYANTAARLAEFFAATNGARTVFATDLKARIDAGTNQLIIDVRPAADYAAGHISGAISMPLAVLFRSENLAQLPTDGTPLILVCHTGHTASMALGGLVSLGYNAYVLRFSMMGWNASSNQKIYSPTQVQTIFGLAGPLVR